MTNIVSVEVLPLPLKHYSTDIRVEIEDESREIYPFTISISGYFPIPSEREIDHGWDSDCGMDHVESSAHLFLARLVEKAMRSK